MGFRFNGKQLHSRDSPSEERKEGCKAKEKRVDGTSKKVIEKYCPAKCIWHKLGSFDRSSLKSEAQRFDEKSVHHQSCESPLRF
jgi:hypothetical protein